MSSAPPLTCSCGCISVTARIVVVAVGFLVRLRLARDGACLWGSIGHKDVKTIAQFVGTRSSTQVRTHAQKYFMKLVPLPSLHIYSGQSRTQVRISRTISRDISACSCLTHVCGRPTPALGRAGISRWHPGTPLQLAHTLLCVAHYGRVGTTGAAQEAGGEPRDQQLQQPRPRPL